MGSYDTGETRFRPAPPRRERTTPATPPANVEDVVQPEATPDYDRSLKTIVALGGGLTPDRIVQPIPEEIRDGTLQGVVNYLMGAEVATRTEDIAIVEAVQARLAQNNYRVVVNQSLNLGTEALGRELGQYLNEKSQQGEDGEMKYNFADLSIVTHDEGGY